MFKQNVRKYSSPKYIFRLFAFSSNACNIALRMCTKYILSTKVRRARIDIIQKGRARKDFIQKSRARIDSIQNRRVWIDSIQNSKVRIDSIQNSRARIDSIKNSRARIDSIQNSWVRIDSIKNGRALIDSIQNNRARIDSIQNSRVWIDSGQISQIVTVNQMYYYFILSDFFLRGQDIKVSLYPPAIYIKQFLVSNRHVCVYLICYDLNRCIYIYVYPGREINYLFI